jgi:hypothetical protein
MMVYIHYKPEGSNMNIGNEEIKKLIAEIPEGHRHLRTTLILRDGREVTFQEATIANLVRAYITVKTHPLKKKIVLKGMKLEPDKAGYAGYQLIEAE